MSNCPKVIYIMGTARSGSTILEIVLSKGRGCFGAGEITNLYDDAFINNEECSCGSAAKDCDVWGEIFEQLSASELDFESSVHLDKHFGFVRQLFGLVTRKSAETYRHVNLSLLKEIKKRTSCDTVIDSSKYSGRALALSKLVSLNPYVICLTRSPEGLIDSFSKANHGEQKKKSIPGIFFYYAWTLLCLRITCYILRKRLFMLRYEDLVAKPHVVLGEIETWAGIDLSKAKQTLIDSEGFSVGHIVTGNRLRKEGVVTFGPARSKGKNKIPWLSFILNLWRKGLLF